MSPAARLLVVIPTYDEAASLPGTLDAVLDAVPEAEVLVVDDASPDGTGDIAEALGREDPRIHLLRRLRKAGLGPAYLDGFAWARRAGYDFIAEFDADGSHPALRLPALLDAVRADPRCGVAIGSRWMPGGRVVDWPWHRLVLSRSANVYARLALGVPVHDLTAGFRVYRAEALAGIDVGGVDSVGYCFQVDLTLRVMDAGWTVTELPIVFRERRVGVSKMTGGIVVEAMTRVTQWALQRRTARLRAWWAARRAAAASARAAASASAAPRAEDAAPAPAAPGDAAAAASPVEDAAATHRSAGVPALDHTETGVDALQNGGLLQNDDARAEEAPLRNEHARRARDAARQADAAGQAARSSSSTDAS